MAQGVSLCNLFQLATEEEYRNRKPDMIYVYGYEDGKKHQYFYQDDENDMMVALLSANDEFDYFRLTSSTITHNNDIFCFSTL